MDNQDIIDLLKQLGLSGDIKRKLGEGGIAGGNSWHAGEVLDSIGSDSNLKQDEMAGLVRELTSGITGEKRQELKEYISQAAQQLGDEELSVDLLKMMELFLNQD
ncbi:MAG: hypothetical protein ACN4A7_09945 [Thermacetogeniaceae bacterium]|mgnify:CR=1 FL=1|jgi:hypothetical protein|nr:hypothetical protein [Thermoanaerobacterales bacterium]NLN21239.1 hypothetical protein [Syntrophomonadaceae bacterium]HAF18090.1 hypothetical protein [Peptococcaceae bacterium]